jgi:hypothetical protein
MDEPGVFALPAVRHARPVVVHKLGDEALPEKGSVKSGAGDTPAEFAGLAFITVASNVKSPMTQIRKFRIFGTVLTVL